MTLELIYYHGEQPNFGDDINGVLWPRLLPGLFNQERDISGDGFLGIGTVVGMPIRLAGTLHIFSSGAGYDALGGWHKQRKVWCVRGPLTAKLLNVSKDCVLTDGAILATELLEEPASGERARAGVGVIPHWESLRFRGWDRACREAGFRLISPVDSPANVIAAIRGCRKIVTESLHGAIVADALGIPWVPMVTSRNVSAFKWVDWCASLGLEFSPVAVPPPSPQAALTFGKPGQGWGETALYTPEMAMEEYRGRTGVTPRFVHNPNLAKAMLRATAQRFSAKNPMLGWMLGFRPARTAEFLGRAADRGGLLSRDTLRDSLRARMLEKIEALGREYENGGLAGDVMSSGIMSNGIMSSGMMPRGIASGAMLRTGGPAGSSAAWQTGA